MKQRSVFGVTRELPPPPQQKGFAAVDSLLGKEEPLEEQQQEQLIAEFELLQYQAARQWRTFFGIGSGILAALFGWFAWQQFAHPWGLRITGELRAAGAGADAMTLAFLFQSLSLAACAWGLFKGIPTKGATERGCLPANAQQKIALYGGVAIGLACCAYWLNVHYGMMEEFGNKHGNRNDLLWVPFTPPVYSIMSCWVVATLGSTGKEVLGLKNLKYSHKSA